MYLAGSVDSSSRDYANQPVIVRVNTELTSRRDWYYFSPGGGITRTYTNTLTRFEGNISDQVASGTGTNRGAIRFNGTDPRDEIVLAGTNDWTGSQCAGDIYDTGVISKKLNTGPGGVYMFTTSGGTGFVQIDGNDSLPRGNGGSNAWIAAVGRYGGGSAGFLLAAKAGGHTYQVRPGYKFILGTNPDGVLGASGSAGTAATLQNSAVCIHMWTNGVSKTLDLVARGPCEFVMGVPGSGTNGAVLLQPTYNLDINLDTGLGGGATVVSNSTAARTLRTRGDGTIVLRNATPTGSSPGRSACSAPACSSTAPCARPAPTPGTPPPTSR